MGGILKSPCLSICYSVHLNFITINLAPSGSIDFKFSMSSKIYKAYVIRDFAMFSLYWKNWRIPTNKRNAISCLFCSICYVFCRMLEALQNTKRVIVESLTYLTAKSRADYKYRQDRPIFNLVSSKVNLTAKSQSDYEYRQNWPIFNLVSSKVYLTAESHSDYKYRQNRLINIDK